MAAPRVEPGTHFSVRTLFVCPGLADQLAGLHKSGGFSPDHKETAVIPYCVKALAGFSNFRAPGATSPLKDVSDTPSHAGQRFRETSSIKPSGLALWASPSSTCNLGQRKTGNAYFCWSSYISRGATLPFGGILFTGRTIANRPDKCAAIRRRSPSQSSIPGPWSMSGRCP